MDVKKNKKLTPRHALAIEDGELVARIGQAFVQCEADVEFSPRLRLQERLHAQLAAHLRKTESVESFVKYHSV